jgi:antitoxin component YwqK of YwqJK toxin-antitoxin module
MTTHREYWDSKKEKIRCEIPSRDEQTHGITRRWRPNGQLISEYVWVNGKIIDTYNEVLNKYGKLWFLLNFGVKI